MLISFRLIISVNFNSIELGVISTISESEGEVLTVSICAEALVIPDIENKVAIAQILKIPRTLRPFITILFIVPLNVNRSTLLTLA